MDAQSGHEKTITGILPALAGANSIYGSGMLELGMAFSNEQFVIDNDIISMIKKAMEGIPVSEETLAVEAIKKVGAGNNHLGNKVTRDNFGLVSNPMLLDRMMYGDWAMAGSKNIMEAAHEKVKDILANHTVKPIDSDIVKDLQAIVKEADKNHMKL